MSHASARDFGTVSFAAHQQGKRKGQAHDRPGPGGLHISNRRTSAAVLWPEDQTEVES